MINRRAFLVSLLAFPVAGRIKPEHACYIGVDLAARRDIAVMFKITAHDREDVRSVFRRKIAPLIKAVPNA